MKLKIFLTSEMEALIPDTIEYKKYEYNSLFDTNTGELLEIGNNAVIYADEKPLISWLKNFEYIWIYNDKYDEYFKFQITEESIKKFYLN